ncbi:MAG: hypothetical protein QOF76_2014 [Solirubrobacteraceae bacterium]|jgi:hypothetical protein|nr:hypothetical protein [Solirubrobacteraceae bacterium]
MTPSAQIAGGRRVRRWSCETIIEKITEWCDRYGEPPCSADWNPSLARWRAQEWRAERYYEGAWPSTNAVKRAFGGSFDAAVRAAGYAPAKPGPRRAAGAARPALPQRDPVGPREVRAAAASDVEVAALERRLALAERRADRAEARLEDVRKRARLANERANRARKARDRVVGECGARVRAALDQADAAVRDAEALRAAHEAPTDGPAGPGVLATALRGLASARAGGDRQGLRIALATVANEALRWRDRL